MDVMALGATNMDLIMRVPRLPGPDDEVVASSFSRIPGGSASNFAVGCARLGLHTGIISRVGKDSFGNTLIKAFAEEGVDTSHIISEGPTSGTLFAFVDSKGERTMSVFSGANAFISPADIDENYIKQSRLLHITSLHGPKCLDALLEAKSIAKKNKVLVSIDPGCILAELGEELFPLLEGVDILLPSRLEAKMMTGESDPLIAADKLSKFSDLVVLKLGSDGCLIRTKTKEELIPAFKSTPVDTLGAGDAFSSAFIYGLLNKKDPIGCARLANASAAIKIMSEGGRAGLPSKSQLLEFVGKD